MSFKKGKVFGKFDVILAENILEYAAILRGKIKKIDTGGGAVDHSGGFDHTYDNQFPAAGC